MRTFAQKSEATQPTKSAKASTVSQVHARNDHDPYPTLDLQRASGSQAVQRLFQTKEDPQFQVRQTEPVSNVGNRAVLPAVDHAPPSPGQPLDSGTRAFMEARFGHDFSKVRIHADRDAEDRAKRLGARAFTIGKHISFGANEFVTHTCSGRTLIAHELAHVAQNSSGNPSVPAVEPTSGRAEEEAYRAGYLAGIGLPTGPLKARHTGVALTPTSHNAIPLISYSAGDWAVTADEESQVLSLLRADANLSATIVDMNAAGMLTALLERIDEPDNRRDLLRLLGERLDSTAGALVEPIIQDIDTNNGGIYGAQIQYNLGRSHVSGGAASFSSAAYNDLISGDAMGAFTGSGATGVNSSERGYTDLARARASMFDSHINPVGDLSAYLAGLTPDQRRRQAELLIRQPISTNYTESYAGQIPSRLQIMRAAGNAHNIEGSLVAAIILAEQRDQSRVEDARDFIGALVFSRNTSIGLGQVVPSTARTNDLFADLLTNRSTTYSATTARSNVNQAQMAWLLSSDETNIFAVARYIRILANAGLAMSIAALPNTRAVFPGIDLSAYANHSSTWPKDNIGALGMYYTSRAWTDDVRSSGWGWFVQEAYRDIKSAALF